MLFPRRSLTRRIRHPHSRLIPESRTQHDRTRCKAALERFHGVVTHVANAKGGALQLAVTGSDYNPALCHCGSEGFRRDIRGKPDGGYRRRLRSERSDIAQLLPRFVADLCNPFLCADSHCLVPCPAGLEPLCRNRFGLRFQRVEQSERCLLYTSDAADDLLCVDLGG